MKLVELKTMQDLETYLAAHHLRLHVHGCHDVLWAELSHKGEVVAVGAGADVALAIKAAVTDYEMR